MATSRNVPFPGSRHRPWAPAGMTGPVGFDRRRHMPSAIWRTESRDVKGSRRRRRSKHESNPTIRRAAGRSCSRERQSAPERSAGAGCWPMRHPLSRAAAALPAETQQFSGSWRPPRSSRPISGISTTRGRADYERLVAARCVRLNELLADRRPDQELELQRLVDTLSRDLMSAIPTPPVLSCAGRDDDRQDSG